MSRVPFPTQTKIAERRVKEKLAIGMRLFEQIRKEGGFIGDTLPPGPERLDNYWAITTVFSDIALIMDPNAEKLIRAGLSPAPQSPGWANYLRIPGLFTERAKDFVALNERFQDRYKQGGTNEVAPSPAPPSQPLPSGAGVSLPMAPAPGPPQPGVGSGVGGYGAPQ